MRIILVAGNIQQYLETNIIYTTPITVMKVPHRVACTVDCLVTLPLSWWLLPTADRHSKVCMCLISRILNWYAIRKISHSHLFIRSINWQNSVTFLVPEELKKKKKRISEIWLYEVRFSATVKYHHIKGLFTRNRCFHLLEQLLNIKKKRVVFFQPLSGSKH